MSPDNFTYWLKGFFEISDAKKLDEKQIDIIKDHLDLVFNKVTPIRDNVKKDNKTLDVSFIDSTTNICQGSIDPRSRLIC